MFACQREAVGGITSALRQVFWPVFNCIHGQFKQRRIAIFAADRRARLLQLGDQRRVGRKVRVSEHGEEDRGSQLIEKGKGEHGGLRF